jgi:filamentous hemagglutinin family protein
MSSKRLVVIVPSLLICNLAFALPSGGSVVGGNATISQAPTQTTINQTSQNAVINWNGFDTASNESVVFNQPNSSANVLNRIAGSLSANGNVFILNSSGIVFAKGSRVDVAGLIATTLDVNNNDFMSGNYKFAAVPGHENASIVNNGTLTAEDYGVIALIAPNVSNGTSGVIQAHLGTVELATGQTFCLDFDGDQLINFDSSSLINNGSINAAGVISATGGTILMTNNAVSQTLDNVISVSGTVEANVAEEGEDGQIILTSANNSINVDGDLSAADVELYSGNNITVNGSIENFGNGYDGGGNLTVVAVGDITINGNISGDGFGTIMSIDGNVGGTYFDSGDWSDDSSSDNGAGK